MSLFLGLMFKVQGLAFAAVDVVDAAQTLHVITSDRPRPDGRRALQENVSDH